VPRLTAERIDLSGRAVATRDGREVLVPGLFAGETADVAVVHRSRQRPRDVARVEALVRPHPARRPPPCPKHEARDDRCGGCPLMGLDEEAQREQKRAMLAALGLSVDALVAGEPLGYRWSAKRVAFARDGVLHLGSWARGSHEGADMAGCLVDHPRIAAAADELAREAAALGVAPYDERTAAGSLRYAWLATDGARVLLTLITATPEEAPVRRLAERLRTPDGIAWSVQPSRGNAIRGGTPILLRGVDRLRIELGGVRRDVLPLGFLQPNPPLIARAYRDLLADEAGVPLRGARAFDLYAGSGVTTAMLRARFASVEACERSPEGAAALGVAPCSAEDFLAGHDRAPDLVVANPPRKGLGAAVTARLAVLAPPRIHVMSCGPEGLARDLSALREAGYRRVGLSAYDTLPQTPHVELVAKLRRADPAG
jgi:23S rRNA (uracil1939-C5)-methyltransferase